MNTKVEQADAAWGRLVSDLREVGGASEAAIERGRIAIRRGLPWALGAAVLVVGVVGIKWLRRRRRAVGFGSYRLERRPSLLAEIARSALLSTVGAVSARLAARMPLPELTAAPQASEASTGETSSQTFDSSRRTSDDP